MNHWPFKHRQIGPIGLDIGQAYVKVVQLAADSQGLRVVDAQRGRRSQQDSSPQSLIALIRRILQKGRFQGRRVVTALPSDGLRITSVRLSDADVAQTPEQMYRGLADRFGLDLEQEIVRHIPAGYVHQGEHTKQEVILLAAERGCVDRRVHLVQDCGLESVGMDSVPCALFRCYDQTLQREEDHTQSLIYVDMGSQFTTVVLGHGHQLCFIKQLPQGTDQLRQRVAQALGVDMKEVDTLQDRVQQWIMSCELTGQVDSSDLYEPATGQAVGLDRATQQLIRHAVTSAVQVLAREISLCMRYYSVTFRGHRAHRVLLSGGEAGNRLLQHSLGQQLGLAVTSACPFDLLHGEHQGSPLWHHERANQWAVALGLALKGMDAIMVEPLKAKARRLVPVAGTP